MSQTKRECSECFTPLEQHGENFVCTNEECPLHGQAQITEEPR